VRTAQLRSHFEASVAFSGVLVALAGAVAAGFSLLIGFGGMLSALEDAPLMASLGPLAGVLFMPLFYICGVVLAALPAVIAGTLFFLAAASSILNWVPTPMVPLLCAVFGYFGIDLSSVVFNGTGVRLNGAVFGSLLGLVGGAALFWFPALRPISDHLRSGRRPT
jgi:hypothetical protein